MMWRPSLLAATYDPQESEGRTRRVDPMKLGLVGCGQVASLFHIPAIKEIPQVNIRAVTDIDRDQVERFGRKHGIARRYTDYRSMFAECDIESVLVCTPPRTHLQIVLDAIERGLHVLCEKPFVASLSELDPIMKSNNGDLVVFPAHNYVFTPSLKLMEQLVKKGDLGSMVAVEAHLAVGFGTWRSKTDYRTEDPAGVIPDLLYHVIYVACRLCGPLATVSRVTAHRDRNGVINEVYVEGRFKNGASAKLSASWKTLLPHFRVSLQFPSSRVQTDLIWHPYTILTKGIDEKTLPKPLEGRLAELRTLMSMAHPSFRLLHRNFFDSVTAKSKPEVTVHNARETLEAIRVIVCEAGI
jgi:predicted dehydrogenase